MIESNISGKTQICGIIGDPVEHTLSPAMQNAAFQSAGLNCIYIPFRVIKEDLCAAIHGMRALNLRGLNVTIPHKVAVLPFLDRIDPLAEKIGAVNTIVNDSGVLTGYNTDASGFLRALSEEGIDPADKNVVVLGSGGAARAIVFSLAEKVANLTILNRHPAPAAEIAVKIFNCCQKPVQAVELTDANLESVLEKADILVNTTSVGMSPDSGMSPLPSNLIKPGMVVFDIIYNPLKTRLMLESEKRGARVISGIEMLIWQGAAAFELWTSEKAPVEVMRRVVLKGA
jgi:shikimate dehydrogenase